MAAGGGVTPGDGVAAGGGVTAGDAVPPDRGVTPGDGVAGEDGVMSGDGMVTWPSPLPQNDVTMCDKKVAMRANCGKTGTVGGCLGLLGEGGLLVPPLISAGSTPLGGVSRTPVVPENIKPDDSSGVDVAVVDAGDEGDLERLEEVLGGEVDVEEVAAPS